MRPSLNLLTSETVQKIINEGFALLENPGIELHNQDGMELLLAAGAEADLDSQFVRITEIIARDALESCPNSFALYNLRGDPVIQYGSKQVYFNPGSSAFTILDREP